MGDKFHDFRSNLVGRVQLKLASKSLLEGLLEMTRKIEHPSGIANCSEPKASAKPEAGLGAAIVIA
jgi:hypothetical protein